MSINIRLLALFIGFFLCLGCTKDEVKNPVIGTWALTTWTVDIPLGPNTATNNRSNFLDYTECPVNETLFFSKNGSVAANDTFNPEITIRLKDGTADTYLFNEICAEGEIGFSSTFVQIDEHTVQFNGAEGSILNQELRLVYPKAIKIYNESVSEVIEHRNLTLIYKKRE